MDKIKEAQQNTRKKKKGLGDQRPKEAILVRSNSEPVSPFKPIRPIGSSFVDKKLN
jgi:hypothetical protein